MVLLGDFNMVENWADKTRQFSTMVSLLERALFEAMRTALRVNDNLRSAGSLRFSWDNNRQGTEHCLARLDRIYFFEANPGAPNRNLLSYCIKRDFPRSDHYHVVATI